LIRERSEREKLEDLLASMESAVVAFSGGLDSTPLLAGLTKADVGALSKGTAPLTGSWVPGDHDLERSEGSFSDVPGVSDERIGEEIDRTSRGRDLH
jgi:predicted PP-loop superfamily ATPase